MTGIVDWAAARARMVLAFIALSLIVGGFAYVGLPKEGEPDIEIPALFVSVPFPGISAEDSESLLVKPMETELADLDGLKTMTGTAAEGYAGVALEFEFGWDKTTIIADVRDAMNTAEAQVSRRRRAILDQRDQLLRIPDHHREPDRRRARTHHGALAKELAGPARSARRGARGRHRRQPRRDARGGDRPAAARGLQRHRRRADQRGAQQQPADRRGRGRDRTRAPSRSRSRRPSTTSRDIYALPVKINGDRVVTLGDLAEINSDLRGPHRHRPLQRRDHRRAAGGQAQGLQPDRHRRRWCADRRRGRDANWPQELQAAVEVGTSNDQSRRGRLAWSASSKARC